VIDWQGRGLGLAANDLVYWIVLSLPVDLLREQEETLPRRSRARGAWRHGL